MWGLAAKTAREILKSDEMILPRVACIYATALGLGVHLSIEREKKKNLAFRSDVQAMPPQQLKELIQILREQAKGSSVLWFHRGCTHCTPAQKARADLEFCQRRLEASLSMS